MAAIETKAKKWNFSDTEIEVLVTEVDKRQIILFGSHSSGITNKKNMWSGNMLLLRWMKLDQSTGRFLT